MNLPIALMTIRWMIRDTIRQSLATRLFWVMLGVNLIFILFCFSVSINEDVKLPLSPTDIETRITLEEAKIYGRKKADPVSILVGGIGVEAIAEPLGVQVVRKDGVDVLGTEIRLGFGLMSVLGSKDKVDAVRHLQIVLGGAVADTIGIFLVLIWTAGFIPTFIEPNQITVLLAKPIPRWSLFVGKFLGVIIFVAFQAAIFVIGTWLALGIRTGVFDGLYLLTIPLLILHFSIFYSFSALLAVVTRNTVVCVFATLLFWLTCWGINLGRHVIVGQDLPGLTPVSRTIVEGTYWIMPKPGDLSLMLFDALQADGYSQKVDEFERVKKKGQFMPELSLFASLLFSMTILAIAAREFHKQDY